MLGFTPLLKPHPVNVVITCWCKLSADHSIDYHGQTLLDIELASLNNG
jgi:hypothetical protein